MQVEINQLDKDIERKTHALMKEKNLHIRAGPVAHNLNNILEKHRIVTKAFHSRSFIGNHCNKYLVPRVYRDLCRSVVTVTNEMTDNTHLHHQAKCIQGKFYHLNRLFDEVNEEIKDTTPVNNTDIPTIEKAIATYMDFYRTTFPDKRVTPKQHLLEQHCLNFIQRWKFRMAFHGEQGVELLHSTIEKQRRKLWQCRNKGELIRLLITCQHLKSSPDIQRTPVKKKKKKC